MFYIKILDCEIIEDFASVKIEYKTWDDSKLKRYWFTNKVNKKGITHGNIDGFKIKFDVLNKLVLKIKDVSTIRDGTAKICKYINNMR